MKKTLNRIRSATVIFLFAFLTFFQAVNAQQLAGSAVSNGASTVSGGNYTGYVSAGQMATYLYSNGVQTATQGIILNEISSETEFTFVLNGNLTVTEDQNLKSGELRLKSAVEVLTGNPLAYAKVYLIDAETEEIFAETTTDENGFFEFKNVKYRNFFFTVNTPQLPENPVLLAFKSNIFVKEVVINGEVGTEGISASVAITPVNTCNPGNPDYRIWFRDFDGDGYGNPWFWVGQCSQPTGYVLNNLDPDDSNPNITPETEKICTTIAVKQGWNIFSANSIPVTDNMEQLFQPFITRNSLAKIQDQTGSSLENWGIFGGWKNNIKKIVPSEGYKIKVNSEDIIEICGKPVSYPYPIPLNAGWNIMGFPQTFPVDGMEVIQQLIDSGKLIKVQDETGKSIEDWGIFGGWKNGIGDFEPGKGYSIKVKDEVTLWIYGNYEKSSTIKPEMLAATHFKTAFEGNGLDHMNINLVNLPVHIFRAGDELAVFDGEICVGAVKISPNNIISRSISIPASSKDNQGMPGFNEGNQITLKYHDFGRNEEIALQPEFVSGSSTFKRNESTVVSLEKFTVTGNGQISTFSENEIRCYPNPFNDRVNIEINLSKDAQVQVEIVNQLGQRVKFILTEQLLNSGLHNISWEGRNANSQPVPQGIYHVRVMIDGEVVNRKIVLAK
jgi:hypothetical protein